MAMAQSGTALEPLGAGEPGSNTGDARDLTDTFGSENMGARTPLAPTMIANIGELEGLNNDQ
eukprot:CAMPEP_0204130198 /NCGR_PEP_ID=MMETSP0361-20130328/13213_1 /ASSEMBLY_ACC=CAM_ASM_000343 /TAXON_ID=268821 /ORGANISM="Scrippsiella Hangoei, Strain SHTV-5" /LENGTH=61 /DNA_ID=CAMNT_0051082723 /DNA_START=150 /DNA_END=332 /DNA_ORIENTATION=+